MWAAEGGMTFAWILGDSLLVHDEQIASTVVVGIPNYDGKRIRLSMVNKHCREWLVHD
jgi:hypothetical protein